MSLVKPFVAVQRVQVPSDQSSKQVSSERCDSPGDSWVRSEAYTAWEAGREDSAPKSLYRCDAEQTHR